MHSMRKSTMRWLLVSLLLPGYLLLLSANRDTDGSFALWLDLTLDTSLGKSLSTGPEGTQNPLLIGEWKQYRQVNTSTTPTEKPEIRDVKHMQRVGHSTAFTHISADSDPTPCQQRMMLVDFEATAVAVNLRSEPMESGLAIGAP